MAIDTNTTLVVKTRDQWIQYYLRSVANRNPQESIDPNSPAWIRACAIADVLVVQGANAQSNAAGVLLINQTPDQLTATGQSLGIQWPPAVGASGYVIASTGSLGATIFLGDVLTNQTTNLRYQVQTTALYTNGQSIPVIGIDTGPLTNVPSGTPLAWNAPRPGCLPTALVQQQTNAPVGTGLTGGADMASADEYRQLLEYALANESASGNEATIIKLAENSLAHGVAVQKAFVYPAINGPGTTGICFLINPQNELSTRIPNQAQLTSVYTYVVANLPGNDNIFLMPLVAFPLQLISTVKWAPSAAGWYDLTPWPTWSGSSAYYISAVTDASNFTVSLATGSPAQPAGAGQSIAVYNAASGTYYRKVIGTATGTNPWVISCNTSGSLSDTSYIPQINDNVSPYSDSLQSTANAMVAYVQTMGPGEQVGADPGDGFRRLRQPRPSPTAYPYQVSSQLVANLLAQPQILDAELPYGLLTTVPVGALLTYCYLFANPLVAIYPLTP